MWKALPAEYLPIIPVRQTVLFPGVAVPLGVSRKKSKAALERAQSHGWPVLLVTQRTDEESDPRPHDLYRVGTLCRVERVKGDSDQGFHLLIRGVSRFRIDDIIDSEGMLSARGKIWDDIVDVDDGTRATLLESMKAVAKDILSLLPADVESLNEMLASIDDLSFLTYLSAANLDLTVARRQELLETVSIKARALAMLELLQDRKNNLQVQSDIRDKLSQKFGKQQRDVILREQLRTIREELGESGGAKKADYQKKIEEAGMPEEVKNIALEEWRRLEDIGNAAPEAHVIRNYLDLLCAMPWQKSGEAKIDLEHAREILAKDHYGLEKIKKRILQHLAVMKLLEAKARASEEEVPEGGVKAEPLLGKEGRRGSILLFVGPPGVGKTSLGQSIARALGRKFARVSLGGVRDDAEIRGHRRTYIGAMPGRIIQAIKRVGENNPVLMLDEIDKMGAGFQGDPAAAMLEVLDPEQNANFTDHYLDVPFDLSKVFFIATANNLDTIPGPLLDRMEVIELGGYTTSEKAHIARSHLIPKQLREHGLDETQVTISDEALQKIIHDYTREAGVRNLQRKIATVCRFSTERVLANDAELPVRIEPRDLDEILGPERFIHEIAERTAVPGVVTGLAWTPVGGEILFVESSLMPGTGRLILTGQLGEVMKESAQIAHSLVRARLPQALALADNKHDVHVHVPAGAIPKDGPSAGVAMVTALASLFLNKTTDPKLAMTGEVTLRGVVMPVGGIKEKVVAAHRAGIERVILSRHNEKDLRDVPEEVRRTMKFELADTVADVLRIALGVEGLSPAPPLPRGPSPSAGVADVA